MFPPLHIGTDQWWHNVTCHVTPWHVSQCHALASKGPRAMVSGEWMIGQQKNRLSIVNICCFCLSLPCLGLIGWDFVYFIEISILDILLDNLVHYDCGLLVKNPITPVRHFQFCDPFIRNFKRFIISREPVHKVLAGASLSEHRSMEYNTVLFVH